MERVAFKMKIYPGAENEYKKRHDEIWPELKELLKSAGVHDYSIFLDESTNNLFGVLKVENMDTLNTLACKYRNAEMVGLHERYHGMQRR